MAKKAPKNHTRPVEKSPRTQRRSQVIQEPAAFRNLSPIDRQAIEDYFRFSSSRQEGAVTAMRIRTVKPELYRHRELFDLEQETGLPIRLAWTGLPGVCDRDGRFEWKPEVIKLDILPYDDLDFAWVLDALAARGFIEKYKAKTKPGQDKETPGQARAEKYYGQIPTFALHQRPNHREAKSNIPAPASAQDRIEVPFPTIHARPFLPGQAHGEGKGREGERSVEGEVIATGSQKTQPTDARESEVSAGRGDISPDGASPTALAWRAYRDAFAKKYGNPPPWNAKTAGQLKQLIARIPAAAAPEVAAYYVGHADSYYARAMHPVGILLQNAEKLYTEWKTGRQITGTQARQAEKSAGYKSQLERIARGEL